MVYFPSNLKYLRNERKLNQQETAELLGIKQNTYSNYERGYTEPNLEMLLKISKFFRTSLDMLVGVALDVAFIGDKETRDFITEVSQVTGMSEAETTVVALNEGLGYIGDKLTGKEPKLKNPKLIEYQKEIKKANADNNGLHGESLVQSSDCS